jgi:hypothetical protein
MAHSSEEAAVHAAVEALTRAMLQADKVELERIVADQLSVGFQSIACHGRGWRMPYPGPSFVSGVACATSPSWKAARYARSSANSLPDDRNIFCCQASLALAAIAE